MVETKAKPNSQLLNDFFTVAAAASYLGVSASTLRNWDRAGKLKARRHPINGYRLYKRADLDKLLMKVGGRQR
jgi:MerR family transcriptional regulator, copper efflux regulator